MTSARTRQTLLAVTTGLALAVVCKLIYDAFVGFAIVPNLFLSIGVDLPQMMMDALLALSLLSLAFGVGAVLLHKLSLPPSFSTAAASVPWLTLSVLGLASGLVGEQSQALRDLVVSSPVALLPELVAIVSVPVGLYLAMWRHQQAV